MTTEEIVKTLEEKRNHIHIVTNKDGKTFPIAYIECEEHENDYVIKYIPIDDDLTKHTTFGPDRFFFASESINEVEVLASDLYSVFSNKRIMELHNYIEELRELNEKEFNLPEEKK